MNGLSLVVWSGGFDSTAVVLNCIREGKNFDTCYVKVSNNQKSMASELNARKKILKYLGKTYGELWHKTDYILDPYCDNVLNPNYFLVQPQLWLNGIMLSLDISKYDEIILGYAEGDSFWHIRSEFMKVYEGLSGMSHAAVIGVPPLRFPLEWYSKKEIYDAFYTHTKETLRVADMIWTCDQPKHLCTPCGECSKCEELRYMYELIERKQTNTMKDELALVAC